MSTRPPAGVNLRAFDTRFITARSTCSASASSSTCSPGACSSTSTPDLPRATSSVCSACSTTSTRSVRRTRRSKVPSSTRERRSSSSSIMSSRRALRSVRCSARRCAGDVAPSESSRSISRLPMTLVIGVLQLMAHGCDEVGLGPVELDEPLSRLPLAVQGRPQDLLGPAVAGDVLRDAEPPDAPSLGVVARGDAQRDDELLPRASPPDPVTSVRGRVTLERLHQHAQARLQAGLRGPEVELVGVVPPGRASRGRRRPRPSSPAGSPRRR